MFVDRMPPGVSMKCAENFSASCCRNTENWNESMGNRLTYRLIASVRGLSKIRTVASSFWV